MAEQEVVFFFKISNIRLRKGILNMDLLILLDYRSQFYSSTRTRGASLDVRQIYTDFERRGYTVSIRQFSEINLRRETYKNIHVLYQSSEDPSLSYKEYVEDILWGLFLQGAILIPNIMCFRAHHNKVFMEIFRDVHENQQFQTLEARSFGTYEEYEQFFIPKSFPVVFKPSEGSKSQQVLLARNKKEADRCARRLSKTPSLFNLKLWIKNLIDRKGYIPVSNHRRKFVVQ
jgi:hypothetical protein